MRSISTIRKLVEEEGHRHSIKRGWRWKLHFENIPLLVRFFSFLLRTSFTKVIGMRNAMDIRLNEVHFSFSDLPAGFDNTRILLVTDLHVDGMNGLAEMIITTLGDVDYDFCILGGDYSFGYDDDRGLVCERMRAIAEFLGRKSRVFGVLGNHDKYKIGQLLNECGVEILLNDTVCIEKGSDKIYIAGLDDSHYYGADDLELADKGITDGAFKIMVCHSPERYLEAADAGYSLYLSGHTHGGQVCLPGGVALVTSATVPRRLVKGRWRYRGMSGYTSRGVGTSGIAVRYFCPPEMTVITLRHGKGDKTIAELASEFDVHPNQIAKWKKQLLQSLIRPDQVWSTDITYVRMYRGWLYLVAVMDWFSRYAHSVQALTFRET